MREASRAILCLAVSAVLLAACGGSPECGDGVCDLGESRSCLDCMEPPPPPPGGPPPGWSCNADWYGDSDCDCGCGVTDVDCGSLGCTGPNCNAAGCQYCWPAGTCGGDACTDPTFPVYCTTYDFCCMNNGGSICCSNPNCGCCLEGQTACDSSGCCTW